MAGKSEVKSTKEMDALHRDRIKVSMIINRLHDHIEDKCEMSSTQIKAADILLKKRLPDLKMTEVTGELALQVTEIRETVIDPAA